MINSMCHKLRSVDSNELCVLTPGHAGEHDFQPPLPNDIQDDDAEVEAIAKCAQVLSRLDYGQLKRVFEYLGRRFLDNLERDRRTLNREIDRLQRLVKEAEDGSAGY